MILVARLPRILNALEARQAPKPETSDTSWPLVTALLALAVALVAIFT